MSVAQTLANIARNVQPNAQANVPVIPNNGNPGGVYNAPQGPVPQQPSPIQPAVPNPQFAKYPWLQSSPHMDFVRQFLQGRRNGMQIAQAPQPVQPVENPRPMRDVDREMPVLPNRYRALY